MENIKTELKNTIIEALIPETEEFIKDLESLVQKNEATQDDVQAINEMKSFLEELHVIVEAINENKVSDDEAKDILNKIEMMLSEHQEH